jgi:hypothetical protein
MLRVITESRLKGRRPHQAVPSGRLIQFFQVFFGRLKPSESVFFFAVRGKDESGGSPAHPHFLNQIHMAPAFQAHRDEGVVESLSDFLVGMGLTDQPVTMRSPFHIKFQQYGAVGFFGFFQSSGPVVPPGYGCRHDSSF